MNNRQKEREQEGWCRRLSASWDCYWSHQVFHVSLFAISTIMLSDFDFPSCLGTLEMFSNLRTKFSGNLSIIFIVLLESFIVAGIYMHLTLLKAWGSNCLCDYLVNCCNIGYNICVARLLVACLSVKLIEYFYSDNAFCCTSYMLNFLIACNPLSIAHGRESFPV